MWPDRVSNPGPPTYESGALPIALRGPAQRKERKEKRKYVARAGIEPRTSDLRVRCSTDCATRPGVFYMNLYSFAGLIRLAPPHLSSRHVLQLRTHLA